MRTFRFPSMRRVVLLATMASCAAPMLIFTGCKRDQESASSSSAAVSATSSARAPEEPTVQCLPLAGTERSGLLRSADKKTIYFAEVTEGKSSSFSRKLAFVAIDVANRTPKTVVQDMSSPAIMANDGRIIFLRRPAGVSIYNNLYALTPGQGEPVRISPEDDNVSDFKLDQASSTLLYTVRRLEKSRLYKLPLGGGKEERIGDDGAYLVDVVPGGNAVVVRAQDDSYAILPLSGSPATKLDIEKGHVVIGLTKGYAITGSLVGTVVSLQARPMAGVSNSAPAIPLTADPGLLYRGALRDGDTLFVNFSGDFNAVYKIDGSSMTKVLTTKGARVSGVVELDKNKFAILAEHETGRGMSESDVCFVQTSDSDKPVDIPERKFPLAVKTIAEKMTPLLDEPDLMGATLTFVDRRDGGHEAVLESPKDGPKDLAGLRSRAREIHARMVALSGAKTMDITIDYANSYRAVARWIESEKRIVSFAGVGDVLSVEPNEYKLEVDPGVATWGSPNGSLGPAQCKGTVKNIGPTPITNIEISCSDELPSRNWSIKATGTVAPAVLEPAASGTYAVTLDEPRVRGSLTLRFTSDGQALGYFNSRVSAQAVQIFDVATRTSATTGLFYKKNLETTPVGGREKIWLIYLAANEQFMKANADEQAKRAKRVAVEFAKIATTMSTTSAPEVRLWISLKADQPTKTFRDGVLRNVDRSIDEL